MIRAERFHMITNLSNEVDIITLEHLAERLNRKFGVKVELVHREQNIERTFEATTV